MPIEGAIHLRSHSIPLIIMERIMTLVSVIYSGHLSKFHRQELNIVHKVFNLVLLAKFPIAPN